MKHYNKPKCDLHEIELENTILKGSGNTNGSGKTPPGWNNPHNPHYQDSPEYRSNLWDE